MNPHDAPSTHLILVAMCFALSTSKTSAKHHGLTWTSRHNRSGEWLRLAPRIRLL